MLEYLSQPWHWSFSGFMIVVVMFLMMWLGQKFGVSSSFRSMCSIAGGGKVASYFDYDWKTHDWLLLFVVGSILGGLISSQWFSDPNPIAISATTISDLNGLNISTPKAGEYLPVDLFALDQLFTKQGLVLFILGGFLIGFGTRWAGGCTSGHAITGLSNLQLPSLIAVVGFFAGGLLATHLLFPLLFN